MNKTYFIQTYRKEESEYVLKVLEELGVQGKASKSIMHHETITFRCEKEKWKEVKRKLNLRVTSIFSELKVEA